jgi:hypothetical protein
MMVQIERRTAMGHAIEALIAFLERLAACMPPWLAEIIENIIECLEGMGG